jgi:hypothetical protein
MKALLMSLAVLTCSTVTFAFAQPTGVKNFPVTQAQMAKSHFDQDFQSGNLTINYDEKTVTLILNRKFECPVGLMCAQVMPAPKVITLPIVSVEEGNCGATKISAQKDSRANDGILEQINVIDNTSMFCRLMLMYQGTATYVTSSTDHTTGHEITETSKLVLGGRGPKIIF